MRILNLASVLPSPFNENENDIILETALKHEELFSVKHFFVLIIPYSNSFLALLSRRLSRANSLLKERRYKLHGKEIFVIPNITVKSDFFRDSLYSLTYQYNRNQLFELVEKIRPDIIHGHTALASGYLARMLSREFNIPYVLSVRGVQDFYSSSRVKKSISDASALISINFNHVHRVNEITNCPNHILLPHGIRSQFYVNPNYSRPLSPVMIVSLCRLIKVKNIDVVLKALSTIDLDFKYHIYGVGDELLPLQSLVNELALGDKVIFKGAVPHDVVPSVLSKYDIFVLPSYPETLGRVYFEAMAAHLPVIGARDGGISGYILESKNGFLVNHRNTSELADLIRRLILDSNLRREVGHQGFLLAKEFSEENVINKLDELYKRIL